MRNIKAATALTLGLAACGTNPGEEAGVFGLDSNLPDVADVSDARTDISDVLDVLDVDAEVAPVCIPAGEIVDYWRQSSLNPIDIEDGCDYIFDFQRQLLELMKTLPVDTSLNTVDAVGRNRTLYDEAEGELCSDSDGLVVTCSQFWNPGQTDLGTSCAIVHWGDRATVLLALDAAESVPPSTIDTTHLWVSIGPEEESNGAMLGIHRNDTQAVDRGHRPEVTLDIYPPGIGGECEISRDAFDSFYYDEFLGFADDVMAAE